MARLQRHAGGAEVDVVLERDGRYHPVEIKGTTTLGRRDCSAVHAFLDSYPRQSASKGLIIAPVEEVQWLSDRVCAVPWDLAD